MPNPYQESPLLRKIREREAKAKSPIEEALGNALAMLGVPFVRQVPIGQYVANIYVPSVKALIELGQSHDAFRDEYMLSNGYLVVHVTESEIQEDALKTADRIVYEITRNFAPKLVKEWKSEARKEEEHWCAAHQRYEDKDGYPVKRLEEEEAEAMWD